MPSATHFETMRREFLKEAYPKEYQRMETSGELQMHLSQIGEDAMEMWDDLQSQMMTSPDLPENYPERVKALEAIPEQIREMVSADLIHQPLPRR